MKTHICEGCGAQVQAVWPTGWKGYGSSAYAVMATAEWCPDCVAIGAMTRDARHSRKDAAIVLACRLHPKYRIPESARAAGVAREQSK